MVPERMVQSEKVLAYEWMGPSKAMVPAGVNDVVRYGVREVKSVVGGGASSGGAVGAGRARGAREKGPQGL